MKNNPGQTHAHAIVLSVVIPVYNERALLPELYARLRRVLDPLNLSYQLVLVDDGSSDGSTEYLSQMATACQRVKAVRLSRNFGKEAALTAGLEQADGQAVIILDADLQDPPELIPKMLAAWRSGADVVAMKRSQRAGETWLKRSSAHCFYRMLQRLSRFDIPTDTGDFRLMSRRVVDAINRLPERNRYMKGLFAWVGYPTTVIEYERDARACGTSKWGYLSLIALAFEAITSFSIAPLRWATVVGLLAAAGGGSFGLWIVVKTLILGNSVNGYPSLVALISFFGGLQLLSIGIVGEYVGKTYFETKQRPLYLIRDVIDHSERLPRDLSSTEHKPSNIEHVPYVVSR